MAQSEYNFPQVFAPFALAAWSRYRPEEQDVQQWAREESRQFYHEVDRRVPFLRTFQALLRFAETKQALDEQRATEAGRQRVREEALRALEEAKVETLDTSGAEEYESQAAEEWKNSEVRAWVNRYCWREHERWWDAFQQEQLDGRRRAWVHNTAKVLRKAGGYKQEFAEALTWCWLNEALRRYPDRF
jgi:hypothetical protein